MDQVIRFGEVKYLNETFKPLRVDRSKILIGNLDDSLERDVLFLYADNLLRGLDNVEFGIQKICPNFMMISLNRDYGKLCAESLISFNLNLNLDEQKRHRFAQVSIK